MPQNVLKINPIDFKKVKFAHHTCPGGQEYCMAYIRISKVHVQQAGSFFPECKKTVRGICKMSKKLISAFFLAFLQFIKMKSLLTSQHVKHNFFSTHVKNTKTKYRYFLANFRLHHFKSVGYRKLANIRKSARHLCKNIVFFVILLVK